MRYIDADKLKEHYMWWGGGFTANCKDGQKEVKKIFDEIIDLQPTADVRKNIEAKKVIGGGEHDGATCWFECSRCGKTVDVNDKYCSECGARFEA